MHRLIVGLIAMFSAALLTITAAPADARDARGEDRATSTSERALPQRPVTIDLAQTHATTRGVYVKVYGWAKAWRGKPVYLQKKRDGVFRTIARVRTDARSRYVFNKSKNGQDVFLRKGTHRLRVKVPKGNGYAMTYSAVVGGRVS